MGSINKKYIACGYTDNYLLIDILSCMERDKTLWYYDCDVLYETLKWWKQFQLKCRNNIRETVHNRLE